MKFIWFKQKHLHATNVPGHYSSTSSSSIPKPIVKPPIIHTGPCSKGPTQWCASYSNAKQCNVCTDCQFYSNY